MGRLLLFYVLPLVLTIYCLVNVITSREEDVRNLSRTTWLLIVLFFPFVGSIAWLAAGRPVPTSARRSPYERAVPEFPEYDRPGRAAATDPESDTEFLRRIRERAEEQRRRAREQKRREREEQADQEKDGETG